jgi:hypothetical protein
MILISVNSPGWVSPLACNALSISSLWASLLRGAAVPVKGAADNMLADARAAVRNSASRRVIGPGICFEDETAGAAKGYDASGTPASRRGLRMPGRARKARHATRPLFAQKLTFYAAICMSALCRQRATSTRS